MDTLKKYTKVIVKNRVFIFPIFLVIILLILTLLKISGTSIGVYHDYLYGNEVRDPSLIAGKPQTIRSDEWLVNTQYTIAQERNGFKQINTNINLGNDMSLIVDVPYFEWSTLFKPQNISFFLMPFENAFAFKWSFLFLTLMLSIYIFCLKFLPNKILFAVSCSIVLACSPFVFWWYQTATIAPLCYGILIMLVSMSLINKTSLRIFRKQINSTYSIILKSLALSYLLISFALVLYPPFQIPVAIVVAFFVLGYFIQHTSSFSWNGIRSILFGFAAAIFITSAVCGVYILTRADTIETISNTVYPGERRVASGGYDIKRLAVSYLQPQLQREPHGSNYIMNQSESSNFILLPLFLLVPALFLIFLVRKKSGRNDWILISLVACVSVLFAQLFIPGIDFLTKLLFLHLVPHDRMIIGLGLLAMILLIYMIKLYDQYVQLSRKLIVGVIAYSVVYLIVIIWAGLETSHLYPLFISSKKLIFVLATIPIVGITFIALKKYTIGLVILAAFTIVSVVNIHPIYQGLGVAYNNNLTTEIRKLSKPNDVWGAAQDIYIENIPQISGRPSITGISPYPDNEFWIKHSNNQGDSVYNRYAHIYLTSNNANSLILVGSDLFAASLSCSYKIAEDIDYIISTTPIEGSCHTFIKTLSYPKKTFYFYSS
jgi:hypothetical protein